MRARTLEELIAEVDRDLAWRKKELSALRFVVEKSKKPVRTFLIRAAVALLYAHWEGFVKDAAGRYLRFVSMRRLSYSDLSPPFAALGIRNEARLLVNSVDPEDYILRYQAFVQRQADPSALPQDGVIETGSNLNYQHFRRILSTIGIDCAQYQTRQAMIDERLLARRNGIAHGDQVRPELGDYTELHDAVIDMLSKLREQIADAATAGAYRRAHA